MSVNNINVDQRDMYLFNEPFISDDYFGGIKHFDALNANDIEWLMQNGFLNANEGQNKSPSTIEFLEFLKKYPHYVAFGYAVSPDRFDYGITITGIKSAKTTNDKIEMDDFAKFGKNADEFRTAPPRAWWD